MGGGGYRVGDKGRGQQGWWWQGGPLVTNRHAGYIDLGTLWHFCIVRQKTNGVWLSAKGVRVRVCVCVSERVCVTQHTHSLCLSVEGHCLCIAEASRYYGLCLHVPVSMLAQKCPPLYSFFPLLLSLSLFWPLHSPSYFWMSLHLCLTCSSPFLKPDAPFFYPFQSEFLSLNVLLLRSLCPFPYVYLIYGLCRLWCRWKYI